jgi:hypothetical protein
MRIIKITITKNWDFVKIEGTIRGAKNKNVFGEGGISQEPIPQRHELGFQRIRFGMIVNRRSLPKETFGFVDKQNRRGKFLSQRKTSTNLSAIVRIWVKEMTLRFYQFLALAIPLVLNGRPT